MPGDYNGYTGKERIRGWQIVRIALRMGLLSQPRECSVCGHAGHIHFHSELYGRPLLSKPICKSCHFHLHRRFRRPDEWPAFVTRCSGCDWVANIPVRELTRAEAMALERHHDPLRLRAGR